MYKWNTFKNYNGIFGRWKDTKSICEKKMKKIEGKYYNTMIEKQEISIAKNAVFNNISAERFSLLRNYNKIYVIRRSISQTLKTGEEDEKRSQEKLIQNIYDEFYEILPTIISKHVTGFPIFNDTKKVDASKESENILSIPLKEYPHAQHFPSVTKIVYDTTSPLWKEINEEQLREDVFYEHKNELLTDEANLRLCIKNILLQRDFQIPARMKLLYDSIYPILKDIDRVKAVDSCVVHEKEKYKGMVDCVAFYRGELHAIEWKLCDKVQTDLKSTYHVPALLAAYAGAINVSAEYPFVVKNGLLVIVYTSGEVATVHAINSFGLQKFWMDWLRKLDKYYRKKTMI